jgi:hypothetical protein
MAFFTEDKLVAFSKSISSTEDEDCQSTIRMIEDVLSALDYHFKKENDMGNPSSTLLTFANKYNDSVTLLLQGSYANDTCVKKDSDVDLAVIYENVFRSEYADGADGSTYHFRDAIFDLAKFKDEVYQKLLEKYENAVQKKNKSICVVGNSSRKDCDVVPCQRYKNFKALNSKDPSKFARGIYIQTDDGMPIINYPELHYDNERTMDEQTHKSYKKMVRIFKCMANALEVDNMLPKSVSSFKIECSLYNVLNDVYNRNYPSNLFYTSLTKAICKYIYESDLSTYVESNQIKKLFEKQTEIDEMKRFITTIQGKIGL